METHTRRRANRSLGVAGPLSLAILAVGLGGLALDIPGAWLAFPLGYGAVLPMAIRWQQSGDAASSDSRSGERHRSRQPVDDETDDALATLRERYARGDIDEAEFEGHLEGLLETESESETGWS